ncbi:hypothetical protein [Deinococcus irradiatisoli]|uniref:hypothetical protein n=1 Tax=Deinococcus irradiatisoli TaxID=2202254 RepID=UPI0011B20212|nr:hypothetical protein [Deinococcus irradiatisoli]
MLSPKELPNSEPRAAFSVASDGSVYVADFVAYDYHNCYNNYCPSYAVLTKFVNGQVAWQDYWETALPVQLSDVAANKDGVSVLVNQYDMTKPLPDALVAENTITNFSPDGTLKNNFLIPSDKVPRDQFSGPVLTHMETNDAGKLIVYNNNGILSGNLASGFTHSFVYDTDDTKNLQKVILKNNYVYAIGQYYKDDYRYSLIPLDAELNLR